MSAVFLKLLNISITAGYLILAVLLLRLLLKRAPKWIRGLMWGLVGLRLALPFSIESVLSLIPSGEVVTPEAVLHTSIPSISSGIPAVNQAVNPLLQVAAATPVSSAVPVGGPICWSG